MGRIIGIDYGTKRIGLAVTDPLKIFASPMETVRTCDFESYIKKYSETETIEGFVIGYPVKMNNQASETVKFIDPFIKVPGKMIYRYDFGDGWTHTIAFKKIIEDYDKNAPSCIMGKGDAPPEDVGGPGGYGEFLKIMADPSHEEYEDMKEWADSQHYRLFDLEEINRRLKHSLTRWTWG